MKGIYLKKYFLVINTEEAKDLIEQIWQVGKPNGKELRLDP